MLTFPDMSSSGQQPVLPFGPASHATQSLEGGRLGQNLGMVNRDTPVAHGTSWFTVLMLDSTGESPTATLTVPVQFSGVGVGIQQDIYSLLKDMEGVHMHHDRILISVPTEGVHDTILQRVLTHLQVGGDGVCPLEYIPGQGVPQLGHAPTSSSDPPLSVHLV